GDSRLFDGTAWYLQSGTTIREAASAPLSPNDREQESEEDDPRLLTGTQTLKCSGHMLKSPRVHKRLKDIGRTMSSWSRCLGGRGQRRLGGVRLNWRRSGGEGEGEAEKIGWLDLVGKDDEGPNPG
ncbi:hypothetical protein B0H10DRAFT_1969840, partial [Mycena sp. CBHHK59/15]